MIINQPVFTVLLVEDETADADLVRMAFEESRLLVTLHHVVDGVEALKFLRRETEAFAAVPRPDLILLDLNMPRMNGREFLQEVKQDDSLRPIPVVVLTTSDVERDIVESYGLGAAGYVVKPVDLDQLIHAIQGMERYWFTVVKLPQ
ncbi:MAG: response regulator [Lamprobacter sp.]|uniref:response regulator n=1 Tax=Lamprobacter sp. TaxID=3100796 RepID=UPI002B2585A6|nr:response regulator [Lamprobacter sp.]MEA3640928.1 response regulator [Lamprobacter sp.]